MTPEKLFCELLCFVFSRLLELKKKFVDIPILKVLVRVVNENIIDANGSEGWSLLNYKYYRQETAKITWAGV